MILFDTTKSRKGHQASGLQRVARRLLDALAPAALPAPWPAPATKPADRGDWFLSTEIFAPEERPGFHEFLTRSPCRKAALFHDAIPLRHPAITWPASVSRHPRYLAMLARMDLVLAVSEHSRDELQSYWKWCGLEKTARVELIRLGADFHNQPRKLHAADPDQPCELLCTGIIEPRKRQLELARACALLWNEGLDFRLHLVGRTNPHFGKPILHQLRSLARKYPQLRIHGVLTDTQLLKLMDASSAVVMPSLAEGCGLPLLEGLWQGRPCLHSGLPSLRENARAGGCLELPDAGEESWSRTLRRFLTDRELRSELGRQATSRELPSWKACSLQILDLLGTNG